MTGNGKVTNGYWSRSRISGLNMSFSCPKKEIVYRGGVVRFFIPKHWNEEYERDGGGTFYESGNDTGTLRINVLSFLMKEEAVTASTIQLFNASTLEGPRIVNVTL